MAGDPKLASFAAVLLPAFLLLTLRPSSTDATSGPTNIIKQTCKQTPDYNLCVSILTADPRGPSAGDVSTLALVMIDSVDDRATATLKGIKRLMKQTTPSVKEPLDNCAARYDVILEADVAVARRAVQLGNPKFGEGAMNDVGVECEDCEYGFSSKGKKSPLTKQNRDVRGMADVAAAIIRLLL